MFYKIFEDLCYKNKTSPFAICKEIGLSGGTAAYWKKSGKAPKRETLEKISERFNVSVDYLLGREKTATDISVDRSGISESEWTKLFDELSDESLLMLRDYTRYLRWKQDQDAGDSP